MKGVFAFLDVLLGGASLIVESINVEQQFRGRPSIIKVPLLGTSPTSSGVSRSQRQSFCRLLSEVWLREKGFWMTIKRQRRSFRQAVIKLKIQLRSIITVSITAFGSPISPFVLLSFRIDRA